VRIQPIVDWWQGHYPQHQRSNCVCTMGGWCGSVESLARRVGVSHSTMYRRLRGGLLDVYEADTWAISVGFHPSRVWPGIDKIDVAETYPPCSHDEVVFDGVG
jgi:hypothetical protein